MTALDLTTATPGPLARLGALATSLRAGMARRAVYRRTVSELDALRDRDLADLGIARSQIRSIALQASREAVV